MQSKPKKQPASTAAPKRVGPVVLPKPNKGEAVRLGYWPSFTHSHTQPKRSA